MEIIKYTTGMIFSLDDRNYGDLDGKEVRHFYIIVGLPNENDHVILYQCMSITSVHNKQVSELDVPIVLNGKISYINTKNITSFSERRLSDKGAFVGCVRDDKYFSKTELINLLMECFIANHYMKLEDDKYHKILNTVSMYRNSFNKFNAHLPEYRDTKIVSEMDKALNESGIKEQLGIGMMKGQTPSQSQKKSGEIIDKIVESNTKKSFEFQPLEAKGAKHGKQKEAHHQTVKFILRQLHEIEEGKKMDKCTMKTLECFIQTYEDYGPSFFSKHSKRFKGQTSNNIKYHYDRAILVFNKNLKRSISKTTGGGSKTNSFNILVNRPIVL